MSGSNARARGAYWTYWLVFLLLPIAAWEWLVIELELPFFVEALGIAALWIAAAGPGDRVHRWWSRAVWGVPTPNFEDEVNPEQSSDTR